MLSIKTPNSSSALEPLKRRSTRASASPMALCLPPSLKLRPPSNTVSLTAPKRFALAFPSFHRRLPFNQSIIAFAASHEEPKHSELEVEKEKEEVGSEEESNEAWRQALEAFKEQALKMQSVSMEAYEIHSKKALITLKENSEQLKIQTEKARNNLTEIAKEMGEEGKEYLSTAAENSPPEVKEIIETFSSSTDDFKDVSKVLDFHVGIPYGFFLSVGGFLSFMVMGSIAAIRFGIILGGALLALSVLSLKSYKRGKSSPLATKGQAVISSVLFLREFILLFRRPNLVTFLTTLISGAVVAFYIYKLLSKDKPHLEPGTEN
ncbi:Protein FATTY ACID EXPORT 3 [Hibiscus syriacus]|uniref:Protein FATTY ACID EXPORT 3 n=1 Tax=Hibiscus syriacus TaxID=106335 RepID=A0A6A3BHH0_HIBSY|nr:protein FATTY ACID EXPORT 3, chloroplastic-like [Hibiscus syriacus]XP_039070949.1 protein FATTY ACID EXPORT 3, chloroplastic-like [Hibiscus syriacus]KAE8714442.1 Protein FATTY ACID EXPORT 3 [Hibiscus syriacus]